MQNPRSKEEVSSEQVPGKQCLVSYFIAGTSPQKRIGARKEQVPFSMAIESGELMHKYFPKHSRKGTERLK